MSTSLVKGVAAAGKGFAELISNKCSLSLVDHEIARQAEENTLQEIAKRQMRRALQSSLTGITMEWKGLDHVIQAPTKLPPIFNKEKCIFDFILNQIQKENKVFFLNLVQKEMEDTFSTYK